MPLQSFKTRISTENTLRDLQAGVIGEGAMIPGANGLVPLVYADYVASGRAVRQVEDFIAENVLPFYANSHTEASYCGTYITQMREEARAEIARVTKASDECSVIFTGAGATAGLNRLVNLLGVEKSQNPVVFIGPYEHHSNMLPWRESKAKVVEIPEADCGGPDLDVLKQALKEHATSDLLIGSFSAASNVTGIVTDPVPVSKLLKQNGAVSVWDYAGGGPYLPIDMQCNTAAEIDAVVVSSHKFAGGPAASGVLILRKSAVQQTVPSWPGGGTVRFVSPWNHDYTDNLTEREEAGTPNTIGDIRAALVFLIKEAVGEDVIQARDEKFVQMARAGWRDIPQITLLGHPKAHRLPIFSFVVRDAAGNMVSEQAFTRLLSDIYGIQARGGCSCAGPYGHRLLEIEQTHSDHLRQEILAGNDVPKPGWVRLNFSYLMREDTVQFIIDSVTDLARNFEQVSAKTAA